MRTEELKVQESFSSHQYLWRLQRYIPCSIVEHAEAKHQQDGCKAKTSVTITILQKKIATISLKSTADWHVRICAVQLLWSYSLQFPLPLLPTLVARCKSVTCSHSHPLVLGLQNIINGNSIY